MTGLLMKIIVCPLVVALSGYIFPNVEFSSFYQPIIVGLILAIVGHMMEVFMLRSGTALTSDIADFIASTLLVYFVSNLFIGSVVTLFGAVLTALLLTLVEIPTHRWLIRSGKAEKSGA